MDFIEWLEALSQKKKSRVKTEDDVWALWILYLGEIYGTASSADQEGRWDGDNLFGDHTPVPQLVARLSGIAAYLLRKYLPQCTLTRDLTLYRGTTELWERAVIEAQLPGCSLITGQYMQRMARMNLNLDQTIRQRIRGQPCSMLRSGKEVVLGTPPPPLHQLTAQNINSEVNARVGVETAMGTPNFYSHFVPCGTSSGISSGFGKGSYYRFRIQGRIYGSEPWELERYICERPFLPGYAVPLFKGGKNEVLAYTGTLITSVQVITGQKVIYEVMNSLD